jgi:DivIVA domain-containing protein
MPDQNEAASEHSIMQEITQPLAELPSDPVAAVASVDFPLVLRGYDREAVDEYVRRTTQLVAELYATRSPEGAVRRALERVGEQVSSILARAHDTSEGITSQSRAEAEERVMRARAEAEELERDAHALAAQLERETDERARAREQAAELRVQEFDAEVERIWAERDRIVSDVRKMSEELSDIAGAAATRFPAATTDEAAVLRARNVEAPPFMPVPAVDTAEPELGPLGPQEREPETVPVEPELETVPVEPEPETVPVEAEPETVPVPEPQVADSEEADLELLEVPAEIGEERFETVDHERAPDESVVAPDESVVAPDESVTSPPVGAPDEDFREGIVSVRPLRRASPAEQPTTVFQLQVPGMRVIDLRHLGRERVIGCWQVDDILIDPGPASCLETLLAALEERPKALLLTHIHLDHAGATGSLVRRWPDLEVYVHELGAEHLTDPARLLESARRLYGEDMQRLWGDVLPVPEENLRILSGGERILDGRFEVAYTPGHASHHVSYRHDRTAFVGDVGGVRIEPETLTIPPTPPPDVDIDAWHDSIDQILRWKPQRLAMTHFGANFDIGSQLADLTDRLDNWAALVHTEDLGTFVGTVEDEIARGSAPDNREAYVQAAPPELLYAGLKRYWQKRTGSPDLGGAEAANEVDPLMEAPRGSAAEASTHAGRSARASRWTPPTD